ncbi:hypothetical protein E1B28_002199 [Marasmius oreades]|uniref:GATA-type domain-containing protein n=1 Tax=Marasmius oreades TaxID=181124 RepID=A0A9P7RMD4_9AGAR|nr:uncharacterized protein E1B28_002199 [Marasmius oreades]KAG7086229.1 hypothetical protein E1B28_002199 [Marasmius oreades]
MYTNRWEEAQSEPSTGPSLLRLPTPPPRTVTGTTPTAGAVIDPALESENSAASTRLGGVPPKMRRSPVPLLNGSRTEKDEPYSPEESHLHLSSNSADRSTIRTTDMSNSSSSKRSASPASVSEDGHVRPRSTDEHRGHNGLHHVPNYPYSPMHHPHAPYPNGHPHQLPPPHMSHHGHYYSHPPPPPPLTHYSYYPPPPPPGHIMPYAHHGHPHQLPPPHSYPPHPHHPTPPHLQSPNSPHSHTLPSPHSQMHGHGHLPSHSQREPYAPERYAPGAQGQGAGGFPPPPQQPSSTGGKGNVYPSGAGPPTSTGEVVYTEDAATKLSDRVRRRCYNCYTTDTSTWRRSNLNPGKVLCNKCGLFERTHSRPRPEQFPHKRGPLSGPGLRRSGSPTSPSSSNNVYPPPPSLVPPQAPYSPHQSPPHLSHPSPHPHSPHMNNNKQPQSMSLPPPGSLASPTLSPYPHMTLPLPRGTNGPSSTHLPPILYGDKERRLPQIQTWHSHGHSHPNGVGVREYGASQSQSKSSSLPSPVTQQYSREHQLNGRARSPAATGGDGKESGRRRRETGGKRKRGEGNDPEHEREVNGPRVKRVKEEGMEREIKTEMEMKMEEEREDRVADEKGKDSEGEDEEKVAVATDLLGDGSEDEEK